MPPSNSKRKRVSELGSNVEPPMDNKHERFTQWAVDRGVEINGVKAACLPGRGLGIVTTKRVKAGERLLFVPARAMFKPNRRLLEDAGLKDASPQAQLAVSAMSEFEPDDSRFALWRSVLPAMRDFEQCMPMLWTDQLQTCLPNPVRQPLERQMADYTRDADTVKEFVTNSHLDEEKFRYYWLIVNSRSFHWKAPSSKAGEMVLCPFIDYMNHAPTGSTCNVIITKKGYEVKANRDYATGEEILATYGPHSNDKLLVHYGFICAYDPCYFNRKNLNPDDDMRIDHIVIPKLSEQVRSRLQDVGFLGGYALLPATNELCFKTQVAIRATFQTANEWEYFIQNGEDLGEDCTPQVEKIVQKWYSARASEENASTRALESFGESPKVKTIAARWAQIHATWYAFHWKIYYADLEEEKRAKGSRN